MENSNFMAVQKQEVANILPPFVAEIDREDINDLETVGKGSFGTVKKARWNNHYVAVKYIHLESERNAFITEVCQLSRVVHPNIIGLYGACTKRPNVCLVMEYADCGSLYTALHCRPKPKYTAAHAMSWARQCAEGVAYLHAMSPKPLIHRDLKPPNLLLFQQGTLLKICDFGTVTVKSTLMTNNKGSAAWMAPEVFEGSKYTEKCDVFSWGIILWEVIAREQPYKYVENSFAIMWGVHEGSRPPMIIDCPKPIEDLMTTCWNQIPTNRPSMSEVVEKMTALCKFFPGSEEPIVYENSCEDSGSYEDVDEAEDDTTYSTYYNSQCKMPSSRETNVNNDGQFVRSKNDYMGNVYSRKSRAGIDSNKFMSNSRGSKPPSYYNTPLAVEIDPNAWDQKDDDLQEMIGNLPNSQGTERLTVTKKTNGPIDTSSGPGISASGISNKQNIDNNSKNNESSLDIKSLNNMLEEHLRPITPIPNSPLSEQIYNDHKHLVQEYFEVQTEIGYCSTQRDNLYASMTPEQRSLKKEYLKKLGEKESLLKLQATLKQQLELSKTHRNVQQQTNMGSTPILHQSHLQQSTPPPPPPPMNRQNPTAEGGWVIVPHTKSDNRNVN